MPRKEGRNCYDERILHFVVEELAEEMHSTFDGRANNSQHEKGAFPLFGKTAETEILFCFGIRCFSSMLIFRLPLASVAQKVKSAGGQRKRCQSVACFIFPVITV